ncbi:uncharacterized protein [Eurosta solidaginis]|uniref:uncharacterized protein n=1 Tax=Eurosta solidaginis TaxID=178769 RepID=UPI0035309B2B
MQQANNIAKTEEEAVIKFLKSKFANRNLKEILCEIFDERFILSVNWTGGQSKIAVRDYKIFSYHLFEAVKDKYQNYSEFEDKVKDAFREAKLKFYRKTYKLKAAN